MTYVYFDPEKVRQAALEAADASLEIALAKAGSDHEREHIMAQAALCPAAAEVSVQIVQMMNRRGSDQFIGVALGNFLAEAAANAIVNADDPDVMYDAITRVFAKALMAHLGDDDEGFATSGPRLVPGEQGGRA